MKDIPGFEGRYAVTEDGRVWAYKKNRIHRLSGTIYTHYQARWLTPDKMRDGYLRYTLRNAKGDRLRISGHRLVALTYIKNPRALNCVNHIDSDRANNSVENLEWCTHKENSMHMVAVGHSQQGARHHNSKLTESMVKQIRIDYKEKHYQTKYLAKKYGVYISTIQKIVTHCAWKHVA